jgi:hypothetical protein
MELELLESEVMWPENLYEYTSDSGTNSDDGAYEHNGASDHHLACNESELIESWIEQMNEIVLYYYIVNSVLQKGL